MQYFPTRVFSRYRISVAPQRHYQRYCTTLLLLLASRLCDEAWGAHGSIAYLIILVSPLARCCCFFSSAVKRAARGGFVSFMATLTYSSICLAILVPSTPKLLPYDYTIILYRSTNASSKTGPERRWDVLTERVGCLAPGMLYDMCDQSWRCGELHPSFGFTVGFFVCGLESEDGRHERMVEAR